MSYRLTALNSLIFHIFQCYCGGFGGGVLLKKGQWALLHWQQAIYSQDCLKALLSWSPQFQHSLIVTIPALLTTVNKHRAFIEAQQATTTLLPLKELWLQYISLRYQDKYNIAIGKYENHWLIHMLHVQENSCKHSLIAYEGPDPLHSNTPPEPTVPGSDSNHSEDP